jgi:hypothetical protein
MNEKYIAQNALRKTHEYRKKYNLKKQHRDYQDFRQIIEEIALEAYTYGKEVGLQRLKETKSKDRTRT